MKDKKNCSKMKRKKTNVYFIIKQYNKTDHKKIKIYQSPILFCPKNYFLPTFELRPLF